MISKDTVSFTASFWYTKDPAYSAYCRVFNAIRKYNSIFAREKVFM